MFTENQIQHIHHVISLAEARNHLVPVKVTPQEAVFNVADREKLIAVAEAERDQTIEHFLMTLDFEDIKLIQTVMYIGRDERLEKNIPPAALYKNTYSSLHWETKEIEIQKIAEKAPLAEYLRDGLRMLGINKLTLGPHS